MGKKLDRKKQTAVLLKTQEERKQQAQQKVFQAIRELSSTGKPLTFPNIAKVAGVSISYLYKWPQVKEYIQSLRSEKAQQLHPTELQDKEPGPHSMKTLHEVARKRLKELEAQIQELRRQNELLRGHVAEVYELRDECNRLRQQLQELTAPKLTSKVVPLQPPPVDLSPKTQADKVYRNDYLQEQFERQQQTIQDLQARLESAHEQKPAAKATPISRKTKHEVSDQIKSELEALGISLNTTLTKTIKSAREEVVLNAIEALKEAMASGDVPRPGGWLNRAIQEGWTKSEPRLRQTSTYKPPVYTAPEKPEEELVSLEQIKELCQGLSNDQNA